MKYYAYLEQHGEGCDYTIGCGKTLIDFEANSDEEAVTELTRIIKEEHTSFESRLKSAKIFKHPIEVNLDKIYLDFDNEVEFYKKESELEKKRAQLEKLKKELGEN